MTPKFSLREMDMIAMVQQGISSRDIAVRMGNQPSNVSSAIGKICDKLGFKDRIQQLREYQFGAVKPSPPINRIGTMRASIKKDLIVKLRHRDGDGCCFCGTPINFSRESKFLEYGPSISFHRDGVKRGAPIPDENRRLAHRQCNPNVTVKDRRMNLKETKRRCLEKAASVATEEVKVI